MLHVCHASNEFDVFYQNFGKVGDKFLRKWCFSDSMYHQHSDSIY